MYQKHVDRTAPHHCAYATFCNRCYSWDYANRTIEEIINTPKKYLTNEKYKKHVELYGEDAIRYGAFHKRIKTRGNIEDAINRPPKKLLSRSRKTNRVAEQS